MFKPSELDVERVKVIGNSMMALPPGKKSAVGVDRGGEYEGKAVWYMDRLRKAFPALTVEFAGALNEQIDIITVHSPACSQN